MANRTDPCKLSSGHTSDSPQDLMCAGQEFCHSILTDLGHTTFDFAKLSFSLVMLSQNLVSTK